MATSQWRLNIASDMFSARTFKLMLLSGVSSGWTSESSISYASDLSIDEATGTGYSRYTLSGLTWVSSTNTIQVDAVDATWVGLGPLSSHSSFVHGVALIDVRLSLDTMSPVLHVWDLSSQSTQQRIPSGNSFTVRFGSTGFLHIKSS